MRSHAHINGHPIHPMLVAFPVAFLVGAVGFDLVGYFKDSASLWTTGGYLALAGIATAVLAAVPGLIDYWYTVPPRSSARKRATIHMVVNLSAVALFALAALLRGGPSQPPAILHIVIAVVALASLSVGGWLGGELVAKNQISVVNRYADLGRWQEITVTDDGKPVVVAQADELKVDQMKLVRTGDKRIVLARTAKGYTAFDDRCPHKGGSLAGGMLIGGTVQCPWHGSQFDAATGALKCGPATVAVKHYEVEERDGSIFLTL